MVRIRYDILIPIRDDKVGDEEVNNCTNIFSKFQN